MQGLILIVSFKQGADGMRVVLMHSNIRRARSSDEGITELL
jgi:hypothetical protein